MIIMSDKKFTKKVQALLEGQLDILNTTIISLTEQLSNNQLRKNKYTSYDKQIQQTYKMYNGESDYGSDILRGIIDIRTAFIGGEGISLVCTQKKNKKKIQAFLDKLIDDNNLDGAGFIEMVETGEMEGKCLPIIILEKEKIKIRHLTWISNKYNVVTDEYDPKNIKKISYQDGDTDKEITIPLGKAVYVKLGGSSDKVNQTTTRTGTVLTQIENLDRALYDLRANNHFFGRITPYFECQDQASADLINKAIEARQFTPETGYAGTAKFSYVSPDMGASDNLNQEIMLNIKKINVVTGIPVHWLGWPDLMSNRATAENLLEVVNSATKKERTKWQSAIEELVKKAMALAFEKNIIDFNEPDSFQVRIPVPSVFQMKQIMSVYFPMQQSDIMSKTTLQNMTPGIDSQEENKLMQVEKEENIKSNPLMQMIDPDNKLNQNNQNNSGEENGLETNETER